MRVSRHSSVQLPDSLRQQLATFRRRLWAVKLSEAVAVAVTALLGGWLAVFLLDRFQDTPPIIRAGLLAVSIFGVWAIPWAVYRWIIRCRRPDQLARLLAKTQPAAGDQLLGVIELAGDQSEQSRSPQLAAAAIRQAAVEISRTDLTAAIPLPKHRRFALQAASLGLVVAVLWLLAAPAVSNAFQRFMMPWQQIDRYTFTSVQPLPDELVVAQGEPFAVALTLSPASRWRPTSATATVGDRAPQTTDLLEDRYSFQLAGRLQPEMLSLAVGDFRGQMLIQPKPRPELESIAVEIELPRYLRRAEKWHQEVRGSRVSLVRGSRAALAAIASRPIAVAIANNTTLQTAGTQFQVPAVVVDEPQHMRLEWVDSDGLRGKDVYEFELRPIDDQPPMVIADGLPQRGVLLESEVLRFKVGADDDFGVKQVGIEWHSVSDDGSFGADTDGPAGDYLIGAGNPAAETLELAATFSAAELSVAGHRIAVRAFAEDYLPGRPRAYSAEAVFDVLSDDQHALWITDRLSRWQRMSLDIRDRELRLHETNKKLRSLSAQQRNQPENQQRLARQAELERAGGAELARLVRNGQHLLQEAMRNPQIGVGHLDRWAEMIQTLRMIADQRMPTVADLLQQAATATEGNDAASDKLASAGQNRLTQAASKRAQSTGDPTPPASPTISDIESSQLDLSAANSQPASASKPQSSPLTLPSTLLAGPGGNPAGKTMAESSRPAGKLDQAIEAQAELLAEFSKVADELNAILTNLEGSTFVKRLKASARQQQQVAVRLASLAGDVFGVTQRKKEERAAELESLAKVELDSSQQVSHIIDDMEAYFQRTRLALVQRVLKQIKSSDVTVELRRLSEELPRESGIAIAAAEYWCDTFDRWAEDLVGACQGGECPGAKAKGSLPPSLILAVMQILEGEVTLREQTRVAQQARPARTAAKHQQMAEILWQSQEELREQTEQAIGQVKEQPDADQQFADELGLLAQVSSIMTETVEILRDGDTGPVAIAAETEIIELLLQSKRFSPTGGGGATAPGGGGEGDTDAPALALAGAGINADEVREAMSATPASGNSSTAYPAEYQQGLDAYFHQLEAWRSQQ